MRTTRYIFFCSKEQVERDAASSTASFSGTALGREFSPQGSVRESLSCLGDAHRSVGRVRETRREAVLIPDAH